MSSWEVSCREGQCYGMSAVGFVRKASGLYSCSPWTIISTSMRVRSHRAHVPACCHVARSPSCQPAPIDPQISDEMYARCAVIWEVERMMSGRVIMWAAYYKHSRRIKRVVWYRSARRRMHPPPLCISWGEAEDHAVDGTTGRRRRHITLAWPNVETIGLRDKSKTGRAPLQSVCRLHLHLYLHHHATAPSMSTPDRRQ
jgi:hypothetical protein